MLLNKLMKKLIWQTINSELMNVKATGFCELVKFVWFQRQNFKCRCYRNHQYDIEFL